MTNDGKEHEQRALECIAAGNKIEAIKVLREATGMGLAEAKAAVDRLASGEAPAMSSKVPPELPVEVRDLARQGKTLEAIKRLRERSNISLQEAKQLVESVPVDPGAKRAGCAGMLILSIGIGALLIS